MVPTSVGSDKSRLPDKFSSVSVEMSHKAKGNSDRALFDRLRLLSLQNLKGGRKDKVMNHSVLYLENHLN